MEYTQMTISDWLAMKQRLTEEMMGVRNSFVRIGYFLRRIRDSGMYEQDGYKSVAEFAKAEYGLNASTVSRLMAINAQFSIDGYSEMIDPKWAEFKKGQLEEMLTLSIEDREMITPETPRENIRELKEFNKSVAEETEVEPAEEQEEDLEEPEVQAKKKQWEPLPTEMAVLEVFLKDRSDICRKLLSDNGRILRDTLETGATTVIARTICPSGADTGRYKLFFMTVNGDGANIKRGFGKPIHYNWVELAENILEIFKGVLDAADPYAEYFGEEPERQEPVPESKTGRKEKGKIVDLAKVKDTKDLKKKTMAKWETEHGQKSVESTEPPESDLQIPLEAGTKPGETAVAPAQKSGIQDGKMEMRVNLTLYKVRSKELAEKARELADAEEWEEAARKARLLLNALETVIDYEKQLK